MGGGDCYLAGVRSHFARENNVCPARTSGALNGSGSEAQRTRQAAGAVWVSGG